jgi:type IV pilus assembly protein PilW
MLPFHPRRQGGVTLIEMMVALVLGLLVAAGIITVFLSTSSSNKAQNQLASLQEEGRFAITKLKSDLRMANGQYCTNSGGTARAAAASQVYLDGLRAPKVYARGSKSITQMLGDVSTKWGTTSGTNTYPSEPTAPYSFPSFLSMRGYDCGRTAAGCKPVDPHALITSIPAMGKAVGDRVIGTDVITVRYVNASRGWAVVGAGTIGTHLHVAAGNPNVLQSITLARASSSEPPISDFVAGDVAMLADCSGAQIFAVDRNGNVLTPAGANNLGNPAPQQLPSAPKVFDFNRDYQTVTYYVKVVDNGSGHTTGALIRRVNGGGNVSGHSEDELVRGVERLDFRYGVQDANGKVRYLTAGDVDSGTGVSCPPAEPNPITSRGCLWRAIGSIEVNMVIDGQTPLYSLNASDLVYSYAVDGVGHGLGEPVAPAAHAITPKDQGFVDQMLRREFTAVVSVRNFNP